ncbi:MAG: alpha/beta hydrolase [Gammaproteobacteria bacterium]|nr:alpha/beta hydrolase [Gammaproteobacteria bacterium]
MSYLSCVEIEPSSQAAAAVIWLHGLGANGHDFEPVVPELRLPADSGVRFVFPHAPAIPVTINGGFVMPAWYDIVDLSIDRKVDVVQLRNSARQTQALIGREIERGIASERIVVAGFSQGGAVAYEAALSYPRPLAGIIALSTYFATEASVRLDDANQGIPIFIAHGAHDPVVPERLGRAANEFLSGKGFATAYKTYPMEHSVCPAELADIAQWLQATLLDD